MKWGIVISSNDAETVWNAFRTGLFVLSQGDEVKAFLTGQGVEAEQLDTEKFKVSEQMQTFLEQGGQILLCGTCLKLRQSGTTCLVSTLKDLYTLVKEADKVLCF